MKKAFVVQGMMAIILLVTTAKGGNGEYSAASFLTLSKQPSAKSLAATPFAATLVFAFQAQNAEKIFRNEAAADTLILHDFPIEKNRYATLLLRPSAPVIDGETRILRKSPEGVQQLPVPPMIHYKGTIKGEAHSSATIVYSAGELYAMIRRDDGSSVQIVPSLEKDAQGNHLLTRSADMGGMPFSCYADHLPDYHRLHTLSNGTKTGNATQATTLKEVEIALEADRYLYSRLGGKEDRIIRYIDAIFAVVSNKYEEEINITFRITELFIYTNDHPDPYTANAKGDIGMLLGEMQEYWMDHKSSVDRDLAHLLTAPGQVGNVGGIAFLQGACSSFSGFGVSGIRGGADLPLMTYVWDSFVVTHEIGHNFSAPHTHDCSWNPPLDSCINQSDHWDACWAGERKKSEGSIMSYCHLYSGYPRYTFLPRVAKVISDFAHSQPCITPPAEPTVRVVFPLGGKDQHFRNDTTLHVRWTSAKVNTVNIEYSLDSGKTWAEIAYNVAATANAVEWKLTASMASRRCLVRVYDTGNVTTSDTSYAVFSIGVAALSMIQPLGGERLAAKSRGRIEWKPFLVRSVNVEFSATGSEPWTRLASGHTGSWYEWLLPDIQSSTAKVRVIDANDGNIIAQSAAFSIGVPSLELRFPIGGEELCTGSEYTLRWQSDFIQTIRIDLSTDGGKSYPFTQRINSSVIATGGSYLWKVPAKYAGTEIRLRIVNTEDADMMSETSASLRVKDCLVSNDEQDEHRSDELTLLSVLPQPVSNNMRVKVMNPESRGAEAEWFLTAQDGRRISLGTRWLKGGENILDFSFRDIVQGSYIFAVYCGKKQAILPITVVR